MRRLMIFMAMLLTAVSGAYAEDLDSLYAKDLLKPGMKAPDFELKTADNKVIKLSDYRGRYVVLDFWASWCPDCRKDIPEMKKLVDEFRGQNISFVGISFDTDKEAWVKCYWETYKMNWTQVSELKKWKKGTEIDRKYKVNWIPTMYLIDPQGKVVLGTVEIEKLRTCLESLTASAEPVYDVIEHFPGGKEGLGTYMANNFYYPAVAKKYKAEGRMICTFNVEFDGTVNGARVVRVEDFKVGSAKFAKMDEAKRKRVSDLCLQSLKDEAVREINNMPKWKPVVVGGRPVQHQFSLPVDFRLPTKK